jgi:hypothetical protein
MPVQSKRMLVAIAVAATTMNAGAVLTTFALNQGYLSDADAFDGQQQAPDRRWTWTPQPGSRSRTSLVKQGMTMPAVKAAAGTASFVGIMQPASNTLSSFQGTTPPAPNETWVYELYAPGESATRADSCWLVAFRDGTVSRAWFAPCPAIVMD